MVATQEVFEEMDNRVINRIIGGVGMVVGFKGRM